MSTSTLGLLRLMAEGTRAQRGAIMFDEEVIGTRNVDPTEVQHWLADWTTLRR